MTYKKVPRKIDWTPKSLIEEYRQIDFEKRLQRSEIEHTQKWREWSLVIPSLNFKEKWNVKVIPPFADTMARFTIEYKDKSCSIYLDVFSSLGYFGNNEPYWELYSSCMEGNDNLKRFGLNETKELLQAIDEILTD